MGFFDGVGANLIRSGPDGSHYYAPFARFGAVYRVTDEVIAARITREWRAFGALLFSLALLLVLFTKASWTLLWLAPIVGVASIPFAVWVARGLPKANLTAADLLPQSRSEMLNNYSRAVGRRTLRLGLVASVFMTVMGVVAAILSAQAIMWLGAGFFALCTVSIYIQYRRAR
jgi:hypothetical protein